MFQPIWNQPTLRSVPKPRKPKKTRRGQCHAHTSQISLDRGTKYDIRYNNTPQDERSKVLKNFWYCAGLSVDVKMGHLKSVKMLGQHLVLFRDASNQKLYCLEDSCPHRRAPLSRGWIKEGKGDCSKTTSSHIVCPYHGWSFDGAGRVRDIPSMPRSHSDTGADTNIHALSQHELMRTFDVEESSGFVWLFYGSNKIPKEERPPIPHIDEFDQVDSNGDKVWATAYGEIEIDAPHFDVFDNAIDISHIHYLHEFGNKNSPEVQNIIMKKETNNPYSCSGTLDIQNKPVNIFWEWTKTTRVPVAFTAFLPYTSAIKIVLGKGIEMITFVNTVPIDKNKSLNRFCLLRNFARSPLLDFMARRAMLEVLSEDKSLLESLVPIRNTMNGNNPSEFDGSNDIESDSIYHNHKKGRKDTRKHVHEISVMTDRPQIAFRNLRKQWIDLGYLIEL